MNIEIEDFDDSEIEHAEGKGLTDVISDIYLPEDTLIKRLAKEKNIDISPLKTLPENEDIIEGPWQEPLPLWQAFWGLFEVFNKAPDSIIGQELSYRKLTSDDIEYYKHELKYGIKMCKLAHEKNKRVRFILF